MCCVLLPPILDALSNGCVCVCVCDSLGEVPFRYGHQKCRFILRSVSVGCCVAKPRFWKPYASGVLFSFLGYIRRDLNKRVKSYSMRGVCDHSRAIRTKCLRILCVNLFGCSSCGIMSVQLHVEDVCQKKIWHLKILGSIVQQNISWNYKNKRWAKFINIFLMKFLKFNKYNYGFNEMG